jgi:hypothetical protein
MVDNPVKKPEAAAAKIPAPVLFVISLTGAEVKNIISLINSATIKGEFAGTVVALRNKFINAIPPAPSKGGNNGGPDKKDK